jgi:hypothetical protein
MRVWWKSDVAELMEGLKAQGDKTAAELLLLSRERRLEMLKDRVAQHDIVFVVYDLEMDGAQATVCVIIKGKARQDLRSIIEGRSIYVIPADNLLDAKGLVKHLGIDESTVGDPLIFLEETRH